MHCLHTPGHTPGSISLYLDREEKRVLFGQDIHGPFHAAFGSDIEEWKKSMQVLLALKPIFFVKVISEYFNPKRKSADILNGIWKNTNNPFCVISGINIGKVLLKLR